MRDFGEVPVDSIRGTSAIRDNYHVPSDLNLRCGHCYVFVRMPLSSHSVNKAVSLATFVGTCPNCNKKSSFIAASYSDTAYVPSTIKWLFVSPPSLEKHAFHLKAAVVGERIPQVIDGGYDAVARGDYGAAVNAARRALEGLCKKVLSDNEKKGVDSLYKLIELAHEKIDYNQPLRDFAHSVRETGNLGSHFDEDGEPTKEEAITTMHLVESIAYYSFELPQELNNLRQTLEDHKDTRESE